MYAKCYMIPLFLLKKSCADSHRGRTLQKLTMKIMSSVLTLQYPCQKRQIRQNGNLPILQDSSLVLSLVKNDYPR